MCLRWPASAARNQSARSFSICSLHDQPNHALSQAPESPMFTAGLLTSGEIQVACIRFQPPAAGGFCSARRAMTVLPVERRQLDLGADLLELLAQDETAAVHLGAIRRVEDDERPAVVAAVLQELARALEVRPRRAGLALVGLIAAHEVRRARPVELGLADGSLQPQLLVHEVEQRLARLLVVERRVQVI